MYNSVVLYNSYKLHQQNTNGKKILSERENIESK